MIKRFLYFSFFSFFSINTLAAQSENLEMLQLLQEDMQEYSQLATQTRQNVDYMPYIISAWDSSELDRLGISTLREALGLVPGVDLSIGTVGTTIPIFRGSNPFAMGQSKLIIDGVVINEQMTGSFVQYLDLPVDMIQRIEVVRGPGSLLSHVNGYSGAIHVITKANRDDGIAVQNEAFLEVGSDDYTNGGFIASHKENDLTLSSDFFYKTHNQTLPVSEDRYGNSGDSQEWLDNYSIGLNANYGGLNVKSRFSDRENGPSYGQSFSLSEDSSDYYQVENTYIDISYTHGISKDINIDFSLGYIGYEKELQNQVVPDGGMVQTPVGPMVLPDGRYFLTDIEDSTFYQRIELHLNHIESHSIKMGIYAYQSDIDKATGKRSDDNMQTFTKFNILQTSSRDMFSVYFDDVIDFSEKTSLQLGIKYDNFSDVADQFSPIFALVHRYDNENIFKFMFSHSYREPAWRERYLNQASFFSSDINVEPETVDAFEISYIHKIGLNDFFKVNTFFLKNEDQIHAQNTSTTFQNNGDNDLYGFELEYKSNLTKKDQVYINYSFVDGENIDDTLAYSAKNIVKANYTHHLTDTLSVSALTKFVDEKARTETDSRDEVDSYVLFDMSINYQHKSSDIDFNLSIKNLFDETYYLPSQENTYPDDYEREGRTILFALKKRF